MGNNVGASRITEVQPKSTPDSERSYEIICISIYKTDLAAAKERVAELKSRGFRRASLSWLIRLALSRLDSETITLEDRP
jgi:hypothetical protein